MLVLQCEMRLDGYCALSRDAENNIYISLVIISVLGSKLGQEVTLQKAV